MKKAGLLGDNGLPKGLDGLENFNKALKALTSSDGHIGLSFSAAHFHGALPFGSGIDPYSVVPTQPPTGNINIVHLGYSYSSVESSVCASMSATSCHTGLPACLPHRSHTALMIAAAPRCTTPFSGPTQRS